MRVSGCSGVFQVDRTSACLAAQQSRAGQVLACCIIRGAALHVVMSVQADQCPGSNMPCGVLCVRTFPVLCGKCSGAACFVCFASCGVRCGGGSGGTPPGCLGQCSLAACLLVLACASCGVLPPFPLTHCTDQSLFSCCYGSLVAACFCKAFACFNACQGLGVQRAQHT